MVGIAVVSDDMTIEYDSLQHFFIAGNFFSNAEESCLCAMFFQNVQYPGSHATRGPVIKSQRYSFLVCLYGADGFQKESPTDKIAAAKKNADVQQQNNTIRCRSDLKKSVSPDPGQDENDGNNIEDPVVQTALINMKL